MNIKRFKIGKLVRDNSGKVIEQRGDKSLERIVTDDAEYSVLLKKKLQEECAEIIQAQNTSEIIEEMGDVIEVIHALAYLYGFTMEDVEKKRIEKEATYGGFKRRVYGLWLEPQEGSKSYNKMMADPEKYPEIPRD